MPRVPCIGAGCRHLAKPKVGTKRSMLGDRFIGGVLYCWFCSRECAGRAQGTKRAQQDPMMSYARQVREARLKANAAFRRALYAEDVKTLERYRVPPDMALAILERVFQLGDKAGYSRYYHRVKGQVA